MSRQSAGWRALLASALCGLGLAAAAFVVALDVLDRTRIHSLDDAQPIGAVLGLSFSILAVVIIVRRPTNRIAWLYLVIGVLTPLQSLAVLYDRRSVAVGGLPGAHWAVWASTWLTFPVFPTGAALFAFLLFPTGRLASRRWAVVGWLAFLLGAVGAALSALQPAPLAPGLGLPKVANPLAVSELGGIASPVINVIWLAGTVLIAVVIGGLLIRGHRTADVTERQQIKLLAYAASVTITVVLLATVLAMANVPFGQAVWDVTIMLGFGVGVPITCGVAILRHHLYDIDRLISRTISYALLTALLAATYVGLVAFGTRLLPFSSPVSVAASTLAVAALFNPLRRGLQRTIDRRFNRDRYDMERIGTAFAERMRSTVGTDVVQQELLAAVHQTLKPETASLWLCPPEPGTAARTAWVSTP